MTDAVLMFIIIGVVALALTVDVIVFVHWLRRRSRR
jgi:hypothetical protein